MAFEVSVNHRGIITLATRGFYGSVVDQSIVKFDGAMTAMRDGCYKDIRYSVYDKDGKRTIVCGAYALSDNGYHPWPSLMYPSKITESDADINWSARKPMQRYRVFLRSDEAGVCNFEVWEQIQQS